MLAFCKTDQVDRCWHSSHFSSTCVRSCFVVEKVPREADQRYFRPARLQCTLSKNYKFPMIQILITVSVYVCPSVMLFNLFGILGDLQQFSRLSGTGRIFRDFSGIFKFVSKISDFSYGARRQSCRQSIEFSFYDREKKVRSQV